MNAKRNAVGVLTVIFVLSAAIIVGYVRMTWMTENAHQVTIRTPACTSDWQVCQQAALLHLSQAINKYPQADQYQVRWCGRCIPLDDTDYFEVTYNHQNQDLAEVNVGQANMDYCDPVTDTSIHQVAKTAGNFELLEKYGAEHHSL